MSGTVLGIIAPHPPIMVPGVGGPRAHVTSASIDAMNTARDALRAFDPDAIVLMSPHAPMARSEFVVDTSDGTHGSLAAFGAPRTAISARGDVALARAIITEAEADGIPIVSRATTPLLEPGVLDHGALVPLSFLDPEGAYPLVELSPSFLPLETHVGLGRAIGRAAASLGRRVAFVASGDCSHRLTRDAPAGYSVRGAEFDEALVDHVAAGDLLGLVSLDRSLVEAAGECGLRSFVTLGGFLEGSDASPRVLAYEGPWGVGYLTAVIASPSLLEAIGVGEAPARRSSAATGSDDATDGASDAEAAPSAPVALARRAIDAYVRERRALQPPPPEGVFATPHGAFVSLHRQGMLRGCIGTISPTEDSLGAEIVHNAIQAATADPRFPALEADELDDLEISVDVLGPPEPATLEDLDPRQYGVIVSADWRRGLLLPDLDGVDTVEDQVAIAMRKAGIEPHERVRLERFRVTRYH
jgi:AmmeMemoRadiSam system protein A